MQTPCQGATGGPGSESRGNWPLLAPRTASDELATAKQVIHRGCNRPREPKNANCQHDRGLQRRSSICAASLQDDVCVCVSTEGVCVCQY